MFKSKKYSVFIFIQLIDLSPCELVVWWHIVMEMKVQISFLASYEICD
jgi:hypothetical protein